MERVLRTILFTVLMLAMTRTCFADVFVASVDSEILGEERRLRVRVPNEYPASGMDYPLLVVLDGANLQLAPPDESNLAEILDEMEAAGEIPPVIAVGVLNTDRVRDMTPSAIGERSTEGGAEAFLGFLEEELVPWAEAEFRTNGKRVLYGHSLAGLLATHALLSRTALFDGVVAASPGLSWDDDLMLRVAKEALPELSAKPHAYYFAIGDRDAYREFIRANRELDTLLRERAPVQLAWRFEVLRGGDHMSVAPEIFRAGLVYVFAQEALQAAPPPSDSSGGAP